MHRLISSLQNHTEVHKVKRPTTTPNSRGRDLHWRDTYIIYTTHYRFLALRVEGLGVKYQQVHELSYSIRSTIVPYTLWVLPVCTCMWHCMCMHELCMPDHYSMMMQFISHSLIHVHWQSKSHNNIIALKYYVKVMTSDSCSEPHSILVASTATLLLFSVLPRSIAPPPHASSITDMITKNYDWYGHKFRTNHTHPLCFKFLLRRTLLIKRALTSVDELESSCWVVFALYFLNLLLKGKNLKGCQ